MANQSTTAGYIKTKKATEVVYTFYLLFILSFASVDVSPIIAPISFAVSDVDGGVVLLTVVSELEEFSLPFRQAVKAPAIAMVNKLGVNVCYGTGS